MDGLDLLDWRRRVGDLYRQVRAVAAADGPEASWWRWRAGRDELFATHPCSPLPSADRPAFTGLPYAPYDAGLRWTVPVVADGAGRTHRVAQPDGPPLRFRSLGTVVLPVGPLALWWLEDYAGGAFLPLHDATAGTTTYGGGRYLLDTAKGADLGGAGGALTVDLNFAYHPSCRYDPRWPCPLAPPENRMEQAVVAGELLG